MPIQLVETPKIEITLNNGQRFADFAPNFHIVCFEMTKKLLEPNKFEFVICKKEEYIDASDIKFDLRDELLGAQVDCSLQGSRRDVNGEKQTDVVDNFFHGYIQNLKLMRGNVKDSMEIHCTAYSPDARLKGFPCNNSGTGWTLKDWVEFVLGYNYDSSRKFNPESGYYDAGTPLEKEINPKSDNKLPYTVQYHESDYDFLKRLAKRYGEFFYYEDGKVIFGAMKEYDPITLRTGVEIDSYNYDLNMNHHTGIVLTEYDYIVCNHFGAGIEKSNVHNWDYKEEPFHDMSKSAFERSTEFFNGDANAISDCRSARILDEEASCNMVGAWDEGKQKNIDAKWADLWTRDQRQVIEQYVMADTLICEGVARRADLKLGSVIIIEDATHTEEEAQTEEEVDYVQHEPLKVIDLKYTWVRDRSLTLENSFKAIPQKATVPPYLERDEHGFLTYGDFDIYPKSGPQHGRVYRNDDPRHMGRVSVMLDWGFEYSYCVDEISSDTDRNSDFMMITPWIRVAQPYGGWHRGTYLVPEVGDEVIVGFEHNNAERPYVIASMHNFVKDEPVQSWVEKDAVEHNEYKAIRTRNGHTIEIRDKGDNGYIKIYDEKTHHYVVTYDTDKKLIRFESKGNIELSANNNIVLHAGNNIKMDAKNNIEEKAKNDINRTAENNILDEELNEYINSAGTHWSAHITDLKTQIHIQNDKIQAQLDSGEKVIHMSEDKGVMVKSDNNIVLTSQDKAGMIGNNQVIVKSDMQIDVKGSNVTVSGDAETVVKGGMVKIN